MLKVGYYTSEFSFPFLDSSTQTLRLSLCCHLYACWGRFVEVVGQPIQYSISMYLLYRYEYDRSHCLKRDTSWITLTTTKGVTVRDDRTMSHNNNVHKCDHSDITAFSVIARKL